MYTKTFKEITKKDVSIAGGKGASLGEMTQAGFSVPDGFVILSPSFNQFLEETDINIEIDAIFKKVNLKVLRTVKDASDKIRALILNAEIPKVIAIDIQKSLKSLNAEFVAVRSSATSEDSADAAWAGQLESYLNIKSEDVFENIKKCWASLYTTRAIFYRAENKKTEEDISVAVVIQKMIDSEKSGVVFSVHPVTQDKDQIVIEAGLGLGEAVVSGKITPDKYVIKKSTLEIIDKNINKQSKALYRAKNGKVVWKKLSKKNSQLQVLGDKHIKALAGMTIQVENHYKFSCDIEWAFSKNKLFILQSRPITILTESLQKPMGKLEYYFSWGERHSVISTESWLRGYVNLRKIIANENLNVFINVANGTVNTYNTSEDLQASYDAGKNILKKDFLKKHLSKTKKIRKEFTDLYQKIKKKDLLKVSKNNLLTMFLKYQDLFDKTWAYFKVSQPEYLKPAQEKLRNLLSKRFKKTKEVELKFITLTTPIKIDLIKEEELVATKLSLKKNLSKIDLLEHAEKFPWLFFNTYDRKIIITFLKKKFRDLQSISQPKRKKRIKDISKEIKSHNKEHQKIIDSLKGRDKKEVEYLSSVFGELAIDRLLLKSWWGGGEYLFLSLFEEISNRIGINVEDLFMSYKIDDIKNFLTKGKKLSKAIMDGRKILYAVSVENGKMKFYKSNDAKIKFQSDIKTEDTSANRGEKIIKGTSANIGKAKGLAYIVKVKDLKQLIHDMENFKDGNILVTTMTQPTMVSLARKAAAIVTDEGGITSHASILAREFGIPCIVGTQTATKTIKDGDLVEVDANKGIVKIIKKSKQ